MVPLGMAGKQTNQKTNIPTNQQNNKLTNQQTNKLTNQQNNQPTNQQTNRPTNQQTKKTTNRNHHFLDFVSDGSTGDCIEVEVDAVIELTAELFHWISS